jgi:hypothetical protein
MRRGAAMEVYVQHHDPEELVAPTGFGSGVSPLRLPFEGLALVTA